MPIVGENLELPDSSCTAKSVISTEVKYNDPALPLLGIHPRKIYIYVERFVHQKTCTMDSHSSPNSNNKNQEVIKMPHN